MLSLEMGIGKSIASNYTPPPYIRSECLLLRSVLSLLTEPEILELNRHASGEMEVWLLLHILWELRNRTRKYQCAPLAPFILDLPLLLDF